MKKILIFFVRVYQRIPGPWHNSCRHNPSCSNYMIEALEERGLEVDHSSIWKKFYENGIFEDIERLVKQNLVRV